MAKPKDNKEIKQEQISFRVSGKINDRLASDARELNISPSQFARNIIIKYYQQKDARINEPSYVQETVVKYSEMDNQTLKNIIQEELSYAIENMVLSDEIVDKFLNEMSTKALEKLAKK